MRATKKMMQMALDIEAIAQAREEWEIKTVANRARAAMRNSGLADPQDLYRLRMIASHADYSNATMA